MVPEMVACTFTLRQFGRMVAAAARSEHTLDNSPDALRDRMRRAVAARAILQPVAPEDDDLADPVRDPIDAFRRCADAIDGVLDHLIAR
jgi:protein-tyrosine phosphatase